MSEEERSYLKVSVTLAMLRIIFVCFAAAYVFSQLFTKVVFRTSQEVYLDSYSVTKGDYSLPVIAFQPDEPMKRHTLIDDRTDEEKFYDRLLSFAMELGDIYDIEPSLILAVAKKESQFNPDVTGDSGAAGLMQVIPSIHKDRIARLQVQNLYDPYENMMVGADILSCLCKRHDDIGYVLMCYNMGEGGAASKFKSSGYSDYAKITLKYKEEIERSESYGTICHQEKVASSNAGDSRTKMHRVGLRPSSGAVR